MVISFVRVVPPSDGPSSDFGSQRAVAGKIFFGEARDILQRTANAVERARAGLASQAETVKAFIAAAGSAAGAGR